MRRFRSNDELFDFISRVAGRIEAEGNAAVAAEVRDCFRVLNGLTDGWALFREQLQRTLDRHGDALGDSARTDLQAIVRAAKKALYR